MSFHKKETEKIELVARPGWLDGLPPGRVHAALAVVHGGHVELVLVPVQVDGAVDQPDDSRVGLDPEQSRCGGSTNKSKCYSVSVL